MTDSAFVPPAAVRRDEIPFSIQVLSLLFFGTFAIVAVSLAFAHFWPAGLALAVILGWRGGFVPVPHRRENIGEVAARVAALGPEAQARHRSSGNASFDAYREATLTRLEQEQDSFDAFVERLRAARDKQEFDRFLDDRLALSRDAAQD